jgi:hypothetical protein
VHLRVFVYGIFYFGAGSVVTKPRHQCVPPPGAIAADLAGAAAAITLTPESFLKLQAMKLMPKPRTFPGLKRKAYDLDEVRTMFRALPREGEESSLNLSADSEDTDPWSKVGV